jgi:ORF6N domain
MSPLPVPILTIRGLPVLLDYDLARLYDVPVKVLNQAVKRNPERFPADFVFQISRDEWVSLRSQLVISASQEVDNEGVDSNRSQIVTLKKNEGLRGRSSKYLPWAFTEHGALMAANILRSPEAIRMSVFIIRAFVKQREALSANAQILRLLHDIDRTLLEHDDALRDLYEKLLPLLTQPEPPRRKIGFQHDCLVDGATALR